MKKMNTMKVMGIACLCGGLAYTAFAGNSTEEETPKVVEVKVECQQAGGALRETQDLLITKQIDLKKIREQLLKEFSEEEVQEMMGRIESATSNIKMFNVSCDPKPATCVKFGEDVDVDVKMEKTFVVKSENGDAETKMVGVIRTVDEDGNEVVRELSQDEMKEHVFVKEITDGENVHFSNTSVGEDGEREVAMFVFKADGEDFETVELSEGTSEFVYEVRVESEDGEDKTQRRMVVISDMYTCSKPATEENAADAERELLQKEGEGRLMVENLNLYPNPSDGVFTLNFDLPESEEPVIINIVDVLGTKIYAERLDNFTGSYSKTIDLRSDARGHYILNITQGDKIISKHIELK